MQNLSGRVTVVTGASRGVGKGVAIALADVPNLSNDELKRIAHGMYRDGKSQRTIAKAVGRSVSTVNSWLTGENKHAGGTSR